MLREWRIRCGARAEESMRRFGWGSSSIALAWHLWSVLIEQSMAVLPISLFQMAVLGAFFQQAPVDVGFQVMGLFCAIIGLLMFLEGLRVCIMPYAEELGQELPQKLRLGWVLVVAFCLGVLVTYAEPAIAALRPLAALVDPSRAPYLYYIMNQQQEILVLCIGLGVGVAAVVGTLRFILDWPLKPLIYATFAPTIGAACYMQWGNTDLRPILGMAWDCGGVTTGPVTVPILLALGIGVMRSQRQKALATAALESSVQANAGQALEGFGIVTLASLFPVLAVELQGIITAAIHPYDEILAKATAAAAEGPNDSAIEKSPLRDVVYGIRSIMPLVLALVLLILLVLRRGLPQVSWEVEEPPSDADSLSDGAITPDTSVKSGRSALARASMAVGAALGAPPRHASSAASRSLARASMAMAAAVGLGREGSVDSGLGAAGWEGEAQGQAGTGGKGKGSGGGGEGGGGIPPEAQHASGHCLGGDDTAHDAGGGQLGAGPVEPWDDAEKGASSSAGPGAGAAHITVKPPGRLRRFWAYYGSFVLAVTVCQLGMIIFNFGLSYSFTVLGNQTGTTLPAAFLEVPYNSKSPYYAYALGLTIVIVVLFLMGVLATRAEPALQVLGRTVNKLSGGSFTAGMLIGAVCVGVGVGMAAGAMKILYDLPLIWFLLGKYAVAIGLTIVTDESITAVAWDSAGVTTGPVTVPFVLAIGIGFSQAVGSAEGFGMLTVMSVAPIISVLLFSQLRKPSQQARRQLLRAARSVQRSMRRLAVEGKGARKLKHGQSTIQAAFATNAGSSVPPTPDVSFRTGEVFHQGFNVASPAEAQLPGETTTPKQVP